MQKEITINTCVAKGYFQRSMIEGVSLPEKRQATNDTEACREFLFFLYEKHFSNNRHLLSFCEQIPFCNNWTFNFIAVMFLSDLQNFRKYRLAVLNNKVYYANKNFPDFLDPHVNNCFRRWLIEDMQVNETAMKTATNDKNVIKT